LPQRNAAAISADIACVRCAAVIGSTRQAAGAATGLVSEKAFALRAAALSASGAAARRSVKASALRAAA